MALNGIAISGYRSFNDNMQFLTPLSKINLIIGKNNSGKSNVLRFIDNHLYAYLNYISTHRIANTEYSDLDEFKGESKPPIRVGISIDLSTDIAKQKLENSNEKIKVLLHKVFGSNYIKDNNNILWLKFDPPQKDTKLDFYSSYIEEIKSNKILTPDEWSQLSSSLTNFSSDINSNIKSVLLTITRDLISTPNIYFIPAIRSINNEKSEKVDLSGTGIIDKLARLQNPDHNHQNLKKDFEKVNDFLRTVIKNDDAQIEIPYERDKIIVHMDGKSLPLESLGTGIHEVIILAAAATLINDSIICIEEPEIHLHPVLQKKLLAYLFDNTTNQYFIATHSPHLLDNVQTNIFHIQHDGVSSKVNYIHTNNSIFEICSDLGYRPSDLLQTNSIIWVEGPSDRIYLNFWIKTADANLIEGTHYSIMFYGGRLLNHFSVMEEEIDDFISLTRLNRNSAILIDSDMNAEKDTINETKQRIVKEFNETNKFAWVTKGREIENYIDPDLYETCVLQIHSSAEKLESKSLYSNLPKYIKKDTNEIVTADKIKVAKAITEKDANFSIYDLNDNIKLLIDFIRNANGIEI